MEKLPQYGIEDFASETEEHFFYSNDLANHLKSHLFINSPHKHSTYIAILFTKGKGTHYIDFDKFFIEPGSVFLLNPGQVHSWSISEDAEGFVFFHTKDFYEQIFLNKKIDNYPFFYLQKNHPVLYLTLENLLLVESLFKEIYTEFNGKKSHSSEKIQLLVDLTYIELTRLYEIQTKPIVASNLISEQSRRFLKFVDLHYKNIKSPKEYAEMMNMSLRHLSRIMNQILNITPSKVIIERVILEAKRILIHQPVSVDFVAEQLGYADISYFIRIFKKEVGMTPKAFQKKYAS